MMRERERKKKREGGMNKKNNKNLMNVDFIILICYIYT